MSIKKYLETLIVKPLTDKQIKKYLGSSTEIIKYSDLNDIDDIEYLLPYHKSFVIILIEHEINKGHWIALLRYNNIIEAFNSYGNKPNKEDFVMSDEYNLKVLQQDENNLKLNYLLEKVKNKFEIIYNNVPFQSENQKVSTCGRWLILRIIMMLYFDMDLEDFVEFMEEQKENLKMDYDYIVSLIIS